MAERRESRRIPYRKRVRLGRTKTTLLGYTSNFSDHGLMIESRNVYPPGSQIVISFPYEAGSERENSGITVKGVVKWSKHRLGSLPGKMGVMLSKDTVSRLDGIYKEKLNKLKKS